MELAERESRVVGDAAHAMPPFLGQGANQAMQDAYVLAKCLSSFGPDIKDPNTRNEALQTYSNTRRPPTEAIMNASRFVGALETGKGPVSLFRDVAFLRCRYIWHHGQDILKRCHAEIVSVLIVCMNSYKYIVLVFFRYLHFCYLSRAHTSSRGIPARAYSRFGPSLSLSSLFLTSSLFNSSYISSDLFFNTFKYG